MRDFDAFIRQAQAGLFATVRQTKGVFCLSEAADVDRMWFEYSDGHRGICIEMAVPHVLNSARKIDYVTDLPTVNYWNFTHEELALLIIFTKHAKFAFETEWRIVEKELPPGAHRFAGPIVTGVIFGHHTSDHDKGRVVGWLRGAGIHVPIYQATIDGTRIKITRATV
jgi:hypothetical protein